MKRIAFPAALFLSFAGAFAFAQQPSSTPSDQQPPAPITRSAPTPDAPQAGHRHQPNPHREALMLSRRLNLTPDQTARLEPVLADRQQKIDALRANTSLTPEDMHQQMRSLREHEKRQIASILTPEQQKQLKYMRRGRHAQDHDDVPSQPQAAGAL